MASLGGEQQTSMPAMSLITPAQSTTHPEEKEFACFSVCGAKFEVDRRYQLVKAIGHGAYGVVCAAVDLKTNQNVAIKKISKVFSNVNQIKRTLREIRILRQFRHENILQLVDVMKPRSYEEFDDVYVVSELMDTDLHQIITSNQRLSNEHLQYFIYQLLRGLKYIHSALVLHRDLKPSNLLLNSNCELKICDFGLARVLNPDENHPGFLTEYVATRWYRAPEIMLSWKEYTRAIDMWAVGCILAELLGRKPLFPGKDYMDQLHLVIDTLGSPSLEDTQYIASDKAKAYVRSLPFRKKIPFAQVFPQAPPLALDLLEKLLTFAPEKRISVDEALAHPFLSQLHDPRDEPVAAAPIQLDFETANPSKVVLKALLWGEICQYHPELYLKTPVEAALILQSYKLFPTNLTIVAPIPPPFPPPFIPNVNEIAHAQGITNHTQVAFPAATASTASRPAEVPSAMQLGSPTQNEFNRGMDTS